MIMRSLLAGLSVAGLLATAAPAFAGEAAGSAPTPGVTKLDLRKGETVATLSTPLKSPKDPVIDGRIWHCEASTCRVAALTSAHALPLVRARVTVGVTSARLATCAPGIPCAAASMTKSGDRIGEAE